MTMTNRRHHVALAFALAIMSGLPAIAAEPQKDWPCVQVKVPDLSPAMVWQGPALEGEAADWRKSPGIEAVARKLTVRRFTDQEVSGFIDAFAKGLKPDERERELTRLFAAAFEIVAAERKEVISGIERFTRRQRELADTVRATRSELLTAMKAKEKSSIDMNARAEIEGRLNWETRIFEDREKSVKYACEVPTLMEQRLFLIGREIVARQKS